MTGPVFTFPVPLGFSFATPDQLYTLVRFEPYRRRDGKTIELPYWEAGCLDCGTLFEQATTTIDLPRKRRCPDCLKATANSQQNPAGE